MTAVQKSSNCLLCLSLVLLSLWGVFAILDASAANASQNIVHQPAVVQQPSIYITPTQLAATLYPGGMLTQTIWISNTGDSPLTFTIYEMAGSIGLSHNSYQPSVKPVIDTEVQSQVDEYGQAAVIIQLRELPDLSPADSIPDRTARRQYVYNRLVESASHNQELFDWLAAQDTKPQRLLIANAISAMLNNAQLSTMANHPQVKHVTLSKQYSIIQTSPTTNQQPFLPLMLPAQPGAVEWNIAKIRADQAWSTFGITGVGAVVGIVDTGVMFNHPALVNSYRGNLGGGNFDHNYSWYDFVSGQPIPYDDGGHGTFLTGIVSGNDGENNQIGVAPGADWIAVKACTGGFSCSTVDLHDALEWMLAPTDLSGNNPDPTKSPDVVLNGWGGNSCDGSFEIDLMVLRAAGILPVFSPGAGGPGCNSVASPADLPYALSAGATDLNDLIATFSGRGPSCYGEIKPDISAPGVNIRSSFNTGAYDTWSGTSLSSAHAAGAAALVYSADPYLGPNDVEDILYSTAQCLENLSCGGTSCPTGANNVYGNGRIDAFEAISATLETPPPYDISWLIEHPISGTLAAGESTAISVAFDASNLGMGTYTGGLGVASNDPFQPFVFLPVTLSVIDQPVPVMVVNPQSFAVTLPIDGVLTDTLMVSNQGDAVLSISIHEISGTRTLVQPPFEIKTNFALPAVNPHGIAPGVRAQLLFQNQSRLVVYLHGQPDFSAVSSTMTRPERVQYVYDQLLATAAQSEDLYQWLFSEGTQPRRLLTANAIAATLNMSQLEAVLEYPQVAGVVVNDYADILPGSPAKWNWLESPAYQPGTVEWNIAKIRADETWNTFNIRGQGSVVGIFDTGVAYLHPALNEQYRGNMGGGNFDHNYNWYDLVNGQPAPYDDNDHGTFGAGIAVGSDGSENQIGVSPAAEWIAVKVFNSGGAGTLEDLHAGLQWMLAPTDLNGQNPDPSKAPHVVLNMWFWSLCDQTFEMDLLTLRAANILPVFAPEMLDICGISPPAASPNAISAGATDSNDMVGAFSSFGPSCYDASIIKPDLVAPGVEIRSSINGGGYDTWSGTSLSTAHLAGAASLLFSADPSISIQQLEQTLFDTAVCYDNSLWCGGETCPGANNTYGHGRIDVFEAVSATLGTADDIPWLAVSPLTMDIQPGASIDVSVIFNADILQPGSYYGGLGIESNDPALPFMMLPVSLTVVSACDSIENLSAVYSPTLPMVGEPVTFTASAEGTQPITYTWLFEDGSTATGQEITHIFSTPGSQVVILTAVNDCDIQGTQLDITVEAATRRFLLPLVIR